MAEEPESRSTLAVVFLFWRRERDSNPRWAFGPYSLSRGAPSATRPSLHIVKLGDTTIHQYCVQSEIAC
jgi:hypothetical protein